MKKKILAVLVAIMALSMFAGNTKAATQIEITRHSSSIDIAVTATVTYDNLVVKVKVQNWNGNNSATFSLVGTGPSKKGVTTIIKSKAIKLQKDSQEQEVVLEPSTSLDPETKYGFTVRHYDPALGSKVDDADIDFVTPPTPVVDVETGECVQTGSGSFEACGIVKSTGTNDTVYLLMEVAPSKEILESDNYREITIFQYDGTATSGEYPIQAEGLSKDTTFYYRIIAQNGSGSDTGQIREVRTLP